MLAKLWKKVLLAICVIAILFNLTSKLVRRYSLDTQLNSVVGGESLSELFKTDKDEKAENKTTDGKKENNSKDSNTSKKDKSKQNNTNTSNSEYDDEDEYQNEEEIVDEEYIEEENVEEENVEEENVDVDVQFDPNEDFDSFDDIFNILFN